MTETVKIDGLAELKKALDKLPGQIEGKIVRAGLNAASRVIRDEAKARAPVDDGDLRESIRVSSKIDKKFGRIISKVVAGNKEAFHARFVEYGTGQYYAGNGTSSKRRAYVIRPKTKKALFFGGKARKSVKHPGNKPQPFMRPAFDAKQGQALEAFSKRVGKRIENEFKKMTVQK